MGTVSTVIELIDIIVIYLEVYQNNSVAACLFYPAISKQKTSPQKCVALIIHTQDPVATNTF